MLRRSLIVIGIGMVTLLVGCGPRASTLKSRTFVTEGRPQENPSDTEGANSGTTVDATVESEIEDQETAAPLLIQDEKKSALPAYQIPAKVRERLEQEMPEYRVAQTASFQVADPHLNINAKTSTMTFTGVLKIVPRRDEAFELTCKFDKSKPWTCSNMFPSDAKVAAERRLQATVNCEDSYRCDKVGLELFVRVGDRTESQLFQTTKFEMRRATSGDLPEYTESERPKPRPGEKQPDLPIYEKPRPLPGYVENPVLTEQEWAEVADDPNVAIEIVAPMPVPAPTKGDYSIPGIETLRPPVGQGVPNQAIGAHNDGRLQKAAKLDKQGAGYRVRDGADRSFGTDMMIGLIKGSAANVEAARPGQSPIIIADIAKQYGGRLSTRSGRFHASHQTGLDADIVFPSRTNVTDMWPACSTNSEGRCRNGAKISDQLDEERLWLLLTSMTCATNNPVIALFLDTEIKKHMCAWVRGRMSRELEDSNSCAFRTLRAMKYSSGHHNHVHVRLRCPGNADCRNATVSLGKGTGC